MSNFFGCLEVIEKCVDDLIGDISIDADRLATIDCDPVTKVKIETVVESLRRTLDEFK